MKTNHILLDQPTVPATADFELDDTYFELGDEIDKVFHELLKLNTNVKLIKRLHALAQTHLEQSLLYAEKAARIAVWAEIDE